MLACYAEAGLLRIWQPDQPFVVLGRSSPASAEVDFDACQRDNIWVGRRCSGGQTIVTGPGCLMYAIVLSYQERPELKMLDVAHDFIMTKMKKAIQSLGIDVAIEGVSDLTLGGKKFSGNSMRCVKDRFLYHGTMICQDFDLSIVPRVLKRPVREPDYRSGRSHEEFLTKLPVDTETLKQALVEQWDAKDPLSLEQADVLRRDAARLAAEKYSSDQWTRKVP